jgi:hypothetical protein
MSLIIISNASGGGGVVDSVTAGDLSIVVAGTAANPTVETGTLDEIATLHPPAAAVAMNGKKITGLANGSASTDAAAFGQIPAALPPDGTAGGALSGTYPDPGIAVPVNLQAAGTGPVFGAGTTGDTEPRIELTADGRLVLGDGTDAPDAEISRYGVGQLLLHGQLHSGFGGSVWGTGNIDVQTTGYGLMVAEGSNAKQGTAVANGSTAVAVANTSVTANSRIFLGMATPGGTPGACYVTSVTAAGGFSFKSTSALDTSTISYEIFEPG